MGKYLNNLVPFIIPLLSGIYMKKYVLFKIFHRVEEKEGKNFHLRSLECSILIILRISLRLEINANRSFEGWTIESRVLIHAFRPG